MKKLLIAGLAVFAIAACSNDNAPRGDRPEPPQHAQPHQHKNADIDAALKACHESVEKNNATTKSKKATKNAQPDHSAIDACMEQKGFKKPTDHPKGAPNEQAPAQK